MFEFHPDFEFSPTIRLHRDFIEIDETEEGTLLYFNVRARVTEPNNDSGGALPYYNYTSPEGVTEYNLSPDWGHGVGFFGTDMTYFYFTLEAVAGRYEILGGLKTGPGTLPYWQYYSSEVSALLISGVEND